MTPPVVSTVGRGRASGVSGVRPSNACGKGSDGCIVRECEANLGRWQRERSHPRVISGSNNLTGRTLHSGAQNPWFCKPLASCFSHFELFTRREPAHQRRALFGSADLAASMRRLLVQLWLFASAMARVNLLIDTDMSIDVDDLAPCAWRTRSRTAARPIYSPWCRTPALSLAPRPSLSSIATTAATAFASAPTVALQRASADRQTRLGQNGRTTARATMWKTWLGPTRRACAAQPMRRTLLTSIRAN